jgi:chemotaxis protein histidine kinase CheA/ActR/RegA family two-component response regulator
MAMDPQRQKIMGYFIEEAREHLQNMFQGLNNLAETLADDEALHEMYRAAHSIKGGAAMLGVESVRLIAYHLEDYFKRIKEFPEVRVDQKLVDLFLEAYAYLPQLLNQLEKNSEVPQPVSEAAIAAATTTFDRLSEHLASLLQEASTPEESTSAVDIYAQFGAVVQAILQQMSTLLSYPRTEEATESLIKLCDELMQWGEYLQAEPWNALIILAKQVIANPFNSFEVIAPTLSHDLQTACDLVLSKRTAEIAPSSALQELLVPPVYSDAEDEQTSTIFSTVPVTEDDPDTDILLPNPDADQPEIHEPEIDWSARETGDLQAEESLRIGVTEMETLSNLFEQKDIDMTAAWQDMESNDTQIVMRAETTEQANETDEDISDFLENSPDIGDIDSLLAEVGGDTTADLDEILSAIDAASEATAEEDLLDILLSDNPDTAVQPLPPVSSDPLQLDNLLPDSDGGAQGEELENQTILQQNPDVTTIQNIAPEQATDDLDDFGALGLAEFLVEETPSQNDADDFFVPPASEDDDVTYFQVDEVEPHLSQLSEQAEVIASAESELIYASEEQLEENLQSTDELADFFDGVLEPIADTDQSVLEPTELEDVFTVEATVQSASEPTELEKVLASDSTAEVEDIFSGLDLGIEDVYQPDVATPETTANDSPLVNLLDEIDTAADSGRGDDLLPELELPQLTDSASPAVSELDELSHFFEFGEELVDEPSPLDQVNVPDVPLVDRELDIPDLTELEKLIGVPAIANSDAEFGELEALIDQPPIAIADSDDLYSIVLSNLEKMLAGDTPTLSNGSGLVMEPAPVGVPPSKDDIASLEGLLGANSEPEVLSISSSPTPEPVSPKPTQRLGSSSVRVDVKYLDSLNNLVGELVVNRNLLEQDQERLQNYMYTLQQRVQQLGDVSQRMRDQFDRSLLESSLMVGRSRNQYFTQMAMEGSSEARAITAQFEDIEFDRYNAFHVLSQEIIELIVRIKESAADIGFVVAETEQVTRELGRITTQVQDDLKQSRMVPFANLADRLPRGVRDRAVKSGKQAELVIVGRETLIDKSILQQLTDPLTHLVNNAVDHGLETPEVRRQAGKPPKGIIEVRAFHQGNQTVITVRDDGAGINPERVKQKAVEKGLKTSEQVARMTDEEAYELLFLAGFSTRNQADEFAGRGVGLDVVKTALDEIRGSILIHSEVGKGTQFTLRLPLTLSISRAVFCAVETTRVAIPIDGFEDMIEIPQSQVILNNMGQTCIPWRDMLLPFQPMSNLLQFNRQLGRVYAKQESDEICVIILRDSDNNYLGLKVDRFLGEHEIVVKQLEGPIPKPPGIAGATVLGDGRVISIVNVLELFDIAQGRLRVNTAHQAPVQVETPVETQPTVLIVDDSITVRELLSMTFSKVGYHVEQAKNGKDALERLKAGLPCDLIFCDIEMPEMDGMELLARLQKDETLRHIPMAMLTSRGADKHRQTAIQLGAKAYFTKPYLEEELLTASQRLLRGEVLV